MALRSKLAVAAIVVSLAVAGCTDGSGEDTPSPGPTSAAPAPWDAPDVDNPMRGQYVWDPVTRWTGSTPAPFPQSSGNAETRRRRPWPAVSTYYTRVAWSDIEASRGAVSGGFPKDSVLERRIAAAAARGQRTIFRVVMADDGSYSSAPRRLYPDYLAPKVREWRSPTAAGSTMYVPDWNAAAYAAGVERLVAELGRRYDRDPRVAGFDISGYGTWGEWNSEVWGTHLPAGHERISDATMRRFVDAAVRAFPTTQLFTLTDPALLRYALSRSPRIGIRVDCLGQWSGGGAWERLLSVPGASDRWRTAPLATETCQSNYGGHEADGLLKRSPSLQRVLPRSQVAGDVYSNAREQVLRWHVSLVSSGNFPGAGAGAPMTDQQVQDYSLAAKWAGYRYVVDDVRLDRTDAGRGLTVTARWSNLGVAPAYSSPVVELQLRPKGSARPVAYVRSSISLGGLVAGSSPEGAEAPTPARQVVTDRLTLPAAAPPGDYDVVAVVTGTVSGVAETLTLASGSPAPGGGSVLGTTRLG